MTQAPTRVLWLAKTLAHGGTARLLSLMARELDRSRFDVEVAYVLEGMDTFAEQIRAAGFTVHCLGGRGRTGGLAWIRRLRTLLRDGVYDLCHTHSPLPAAVARLIAPSTLPMLHTEHNVWPRYHWATRSANALTFRRNTAAIAVSEAAAASIRAPVPVEVVYQGIDLAAVRSGDAARQDARWRLGLGPAEPVIGCVARLDPQKDHDTLLRAFALLRSRHPEARLVLVGDGPSRARLQRQVTAAAQDRAVLFTGARDDVQDLLPAFDVFALTSRYEGLGLAAVEALAAGVPCVVTPAGGLQETVEHGTDGLIVPPRDPEATAAALERLLTDPGLREQMGARAAQRAKRFSMAQATARLEELYDRVLERQVVAA